MFSRLAYSRNSLLYMRKCFSSILKETIMDEEPLSRLINGLFVFTLCENKLLVNNSSELIKFSYHFPGKTITNSVLKHTIFSRFCGGENLNEIKETNKRLVKYNLKPAYDYGFESNSMESKISPKIMDENLVKAQKYIIDTIKMASNEKTQRSNPVVAVKISSIIFPPLLSQLSNIYRRIDEIYYKWNNKEDINKEKDKEKDDGICKDRFISECRKMYEDKPIKEIENIFNDISKDKNHFELINLYDSFSLHNIQHKEINYQCFPYIPKLSDYLRYQLTLLEDSFDEICKVAAENDICLLIDAEESDYQPAIEEITIEMMKRYNKEKPILYTTYQAYLKNSYNKMLICCERMKLSNCKVGVKLVRGAYMDYERNRAKKCVEEDPIYSTIEETHNNYDKMVEYLITNNHHILIATHNEKSIMKALSLMDKCDINKDDERISFGQLYGMSDYISCSLSNSGFNVYKYLPYGSVSTVIPYLIRRLNEHRDMLIHAKKDKSVCWDLFKQKLINKFPI